MIRRVADEVDGDSQAIEAGNRQAPNITVFKGSGRFVSEKTLEVNGEELSAETIVIGAGALPRVPNIKGISDVPYVTSDEALRLPRQSQSLTILGGGYIAAEMGHFFRRPRHRCHHHSARSAPRPARGPRHIPPFHRGL